MRNFPVGFSVQFLLGTIGRLTQSDRRRVESPSIDMNFAGSKCGESDDVRSALRRNDDPRLKKDDVHNRSVSKQAERPLSPNPRGPMRGRKKRRLLPETLQFVTSNEQPDGKRHPKQQSQDPV